MSIFGKAKYSGKGRNYWKLKDGESVYRILPPIADLAEDGTWSVFYNVHYGYKNSEGKLRTFVSPLVKNFKTKMIEVRDPALERIDQIKTKLKTAQAAGDTELAVELMKLAGGKKSRFNLDSNHYMNVVDLQGNIGILKIRHRCMTALKAEIERLRTQGIEPLDAENGIYFSFTRSGTGLDTHFKVSPYTKLLKIEGVGDVEQRVTHSIDDAFGKRCAVQNQDGTFSYKEAARLDNLFRRLTTEEVQRLVTEGEKAVDEIFDTKVDVGQDYAADDGTDDDEPATINTVPASTTNSATNTVAVTGTSAPVTQAAPATPTVTVAPTPSSSAPTTPQTTGQTIAQQTDEDFLKNLGI